MRLDAADALGDDQTPESVDELPGVPDFVITEPGPASSRSWTGQPTASRPSASRRRCATRSTLRQASSTRPDARRAWHRSTLGTIATTAIEATRPSLTIPRRVLARHLRPAAHQRDLVIPPTQTFVEPMAYPVIDLPMYEPLENLSSELFLPNINLIEPNSVTLLETNQRVHRVLHGRPQPRVRARAAVARVPDRPARIDFRQFWDVRSFFNADSLDDEA